VKVAHSLLALAFGALATLGPATPATAQASADSIARFVARAREATRRFHDRSAAIEAGYRRIGPDFPGMGEHWISIGLLFRSSFDAAHPAVLEYVNSGGEPRLVGVAYVLPLLPGESAPAFPSPHAWHSHTKSLDEESAAIAQVSLAHGGGDGSRLAMLHAWIWLGDGDSTFAANNWVLPFLRLGLEPPGGAIPPEAARALSLASGGDAFYESIYQRAISSASDSATIATAVGTARSQVDSLVAARRGATDTVGPQELEQLMRIWSALWKQLESELPPSSYRTLGELRQP
jgi:hypothetical protein